jgi:hypothetical protein
MARESPPVMIVLPRRNKEAQHHLPERGQLELGEIGTGHAGGLILVLIRQK